MAAGAAPATGPRLRVPARTKYQIPNTNTAELHALAPGSWLAAGRRGSVVARSSTARMLLKQSTRRWPAPALLQWQWPVPVPPVRPRPRPPPHTHTPYTHTRYTLLRPSPAGAPDEWLPRPQGAKPSRSMSWLGGLVVAPCLALEVRSACLSTGGHIGISSSVCQDEFVITECNTPAPVCCCGLFPKNKQKSALQLLLRHFVTRSRSGLAPIGANSWRST
jgi:hypothetical protein